MVWSVILCSRLATRASQTDLRAGGQAARRERAGVERRGPRAGDGEGGAGRRGRGEQPPANPPGDAFGLSASLCGRRGRRENAAGD